MGKCNWLPRGYVTPSALERKGWTTREIMRYLGKPDDTIKHPRYGTHVLLYRKTRVAEANIERLAAREAAKYERECDRKLSRAANEIEREIQRKQEESKRRVREERFNSLRAIYGLPDELQ